MNYKLSLYSLCTPTQQGDAQQSVLVDMPEVHGRLLDILALLLSRGVDPTARDSEGNTPSDKASVIRTREECFLDGALLIGGYTEFKKVCVCMSQIDTMSMVCIMYTTSQSVTTMCILHCLWYIIWYI